MESQSGVDTDLYTLTRYTIKRQKTLGPTATGSLTLLIASIQLGCKFVAMSVRRAGISKMLVGEVCGGVRVRVCTEALCTEAGDRSICRRLTDISSLHRMDPIRNSRIIHIVVAIAGVAMVATWCLTQGICVAVWSL